MEPTTVAKVLPLVICILIAIVAVYVMIKWVQYLFSQWVSVRSCWGSSSGWTSVLCVVIWVVYLLEWLAWVAVVILCGYVLVINIRATI